MPRAKVAEAETVLAWRGAGIAVRGERAVVDWVAGFLCPPFARGGDAAHEVVVRVDGEAARAPRTGGRVRALTLDEALPSLPLVRVADGELAVDEELGIALRPTARGAEVRIAADTRLARIGVMRVVRELAAARALAAGDVPLHAAAVAGARGALLFVGPRRAGKTTLLCAALARGGLAVLANDRVYVDREGVARGMPTIVAPRPETLAWFPGLAARLAAAPSPLGPGALAAAAGVACVEAAPVARLLFVRRGEEGHALRALDRDEAVARLADGLLARGAQAGWLAPAVDVAPRLAPLAARVPCAELVVGAGALSSDELWRALA